MTHPPRELNKNFRGFAFIMTTDKVVVPLQK